MERRGFGFVVVEAFVRYRRAAYFDDEITLQTELAELNKASLRFDYVALRGGEELATGHTRHAYVDLASGKPIRMPKELDILGRGYKGPEVRGMRGG